MEDSILSCTGIHKYFEYPVVPTHLFQDYVLRPRKRREKWRVHALNNVSLHVARGEWVGIFGPNGSGKTTLLRILGGLMEVDAGQVQRHGRTSCFFTLGVGFHPERLASENIYFHGLFHGMSRSEIGKVTEEIVDFAGVRSHVHLPLKCYSTGMQMRLAFAAMVYVDADVYLLDEVLAVGDTDFQKKCKATMRSMKAEGKSAILVMHDEDVLKEFCDRIIYLDHGSIQNPQGEFPAKESVCCIVDNQTPKTPHKKHGRLRMLFLNILTIVVSLTVAVTGTEGSARFFLLPDNVIKEEKGLFEYDRRKIYKLAANFVGSSGEITVTTNSYGFRDDEIPLKKPSGTSRILILGDSVSFGHGVEDDETYSEQLEDLLSTSEHPVDVINTGVPGNSPFQEFVDLERGLTFEPDIVVYQFTLNDIVEPYWLLKRLGGAGTDYHGVREVSYIDRLLTLHSRAYRFLKEMFIRLRFLDPTGENIVDIAKQRELFSIKSLSVDPDAPRFQAAWNEAFHWIGRMASACRSHGIPFLIVAVPMDFQLAQRPDEVVQRRLESFASQHGIQYIDFLRVLQEKLLSFSSGSAKKFWNFYFVDGAHPSVKGHHFIAETLLEPIENLMRDSPSGKADTRAYSR